MSNSKPARFASFKSQKKSEKDEKISNSQGMKSDTTSRCIDGSFIDHNSAGMTQCTLPSFLQKYIKEPCALTWKEFPKNFTGVANFTNLMTDVKSVKVSCCPKVICKENNWESWICLVFWRKKIKIQQFIAQPCCTPFDAHHEVCLTKSDFVGLSCDHRL